MCEPHIPLRSMSWGTRRKKREESPLRCTNCNNSRVARYRVRHEIARQSAYREDILSRLEARHNRGYMRRVLVGVIIPGQLASDCAVSAAFREARRANPTSNRDAG